VFTSVLDALSSPPLFFSPSPPFLGLYEKTFISGKALFIPGAGLRICHRSCLYEGKHLIQVDLIRLLQLSLYHPTDKTTSSIFSNIFFKHLSKHALKPHAVDAYRNCFLRFNFVNFTINMLVSTTALLAFTSIVSGATLPVAKRVTVTDADVLQFALTVSTLLKCSRLLQQVDTAGAH
jgi:hypothetical protein